MLIGKTGLNSNYFEKTPSSGEKRAALLSTRNAYFRALGGETSIAIADFRGDKFSWPAGDALQLEWLIKDGSGTRPLIPRFPDMGDLDWDVDAASPPYVNLNFTLNTGDIVFVRAPNRFQTPFRNEPLNFIANPPIIIAAGDTSTVTFTLGRPLPLTYLNGAFRGKAYILFADGLAQPLCKNNDIAEDGNYIENRIAGTDFFGSITFVSPPGDTIEKRVLDFISSGFYDADNISATSLIQHADRLTALESASYIRRSNGTTKGSTNTDVVIYSTAEESNGTDLTYVNSATLGDSFLANTSGIYSVSVCHYFNANSNCAVCMGTTVDNVLVSSNTRSLWWGPAGNYSAIAWVGYVAAGQKMWINVPNAILGSTNENQITVARLR